MIYVFLAEGFEEIEALAPVDILRRAGVEIKTVGVASKTVCGSHGIPVVCDLEEAQIELNEQLCGVVLPGGMPGTLNLQKSSAVNAAVDYAYNNELLLAAICAAPLILGEKGLLKGKAATCYSGFEDRLLGAELKAQPVVQDGNIITAFGAGAAIDFGLALLAYFGKDAEQMKKSMRYTK